MDLDAALARYAAFFDTISRDRLVEMDALFTPDARFCDPFNDVRGVAAIRRVFDHMYETIDAPRFAILHRARAGELAYLKWRFNGGLRSRSIEFVGLSEVRLRPDGRVSDHVDYWDSGAVVYERIPVLGIAVRAVRRRLRTPV